MPRTGSSLRSALELMPDDPDTHINLGLALKQQGRLDEADACFDSALALRSDYPQAHYNRGNVRWERGLMEEATAAIAAPSNSSRITQAPTSISVMR